MLALKHRCQFVRSCYYISPLIYPICLPYIYVVVIFVIIVTMEIPGPSKGLEGVHAGPSGSP